MTQDRRRAYYSEENIRRCIHPIPGFNCSDSLRTRKIGEPAHDLWRIRQTSASLLRGLANGKKNPFPI
jgi:hypothetical protein